MNETPDDVLRLIFQTHVHDLKRSPAGLLTVNRRWNAILLSTMNLWTRVVINIDSFDVIPYITKANNGVADWKSECMDGVEPDSSLIGPLRSYLDRSCSADGSVQLPLDIQICWFPHENYESPPNYITNHGQDLAANISYGRAFVPYFKRIDYYGCHLQLQLLLLSLAGIYIQLSPFEDNDDEAEEDEEKGDKVEGDRDSQDDEAQIGAGQTAAEEEEEEDGKRFEQLQCAFDDINRYSFDRPSPFRLESQYYTAFWARNETLRWRSLHFDLLRVAGSVHVSLPTGILHELGCGQLTSLETVTLKGVRLAYFILSGATLPSFRYLEIMQSTITAGLNVDTLRVLKIGGGALKANRCYLPWRRLRSLHTLEIMDPVETDGIWWQQAMEQLETFFTESHPLVSFSISPRVISDIITLFNWYPHFRVKALNIASQCLDSLEISHQNITEARSMLQEMKRKGIEVLSLDAKMHNILELARVDEGVMDH